MKLKRQKTVFNPRHSNNIRNSGQNSVKMMLCDKKVHVIKKQANEKNGVHTKPRILIL